MFATRLPPPFVGVATVALVLAFLAWAAPPARAWITGNCSASIAGVDVGPLGTGATSSPVEVEKDSQVPVTMASATEIDHLKVEMEFAGIRWSVHDEPTSGTSWAKTVNVDDYARYGVGLYKVIGTSSGARGSCSGAALVRVKGNPLTTVAGIAGMGVAVAGVAAVAASAAAAAGERKAAAASLAQTAPREMAPDEIDVFGGPWGMCLFLALPALLLTLGAMATPGSAPGPAPQPPKRRLPGHVSWRPRISILALVGGFLAGLGILVLLQQYAIVYPTRTVTIVALVGGLAFGVAVPSLFRIIAVRRLNRALAAYHARAQQP